MTDTIPQINRRAFVGGAGAVAAAGVTGALFSGSAAKAAVLGGTDTVATAPHDLFAHHCSLVHKAMSDKLTAMVANPAVSAEETSLALRTTFCPCCNTQISANYPATPLHPKFIAEKPERHFGEGAHAKA